METVTRTVRIKKSDIKRVEQFLKKNPVFDFSSLMRTALDQFMRNPVLEIKPITGNRTEDDNVRLDQ